MPDLVDILAVLRSLAAAVAIAISAYGLGWPISRLFHSPGADRLDRGACSLLLGYPVAGLLLGVFGMVGCLGAVSVSLLTLIGMLMASVDFACSLARARVVGDLAPRSVWFVAAGGLAVPVLGLTLIASLAPPTDHDAMVEALEGPKNALLAETFWSGDRDGLRVLLLPQLWSLWGLALDGPVTANLVHWQLGLLLALASVSLARRWISEDLAWLAGLLVLLSPGVWQQGAPLSATVPIGLAAALVYSSVIHSRDGGPRAAAFIACSLVTFIASFPGHDVPASDIRLWNHPLLLIAVSGLVARAARPTIAFACAVAGLVAAWLLPPGGPLLAMAFPAIAVVGAAGASGLLQMPAPGRRMLTGLVVLLAIVQVGDLARLAAPRVAVALGWQSREAYLLAASGSYRAATVFNQVRRPDQRLFSNTTGCLYFASPVTVAASGQNAAGESQTAEARIVGEAHRQGYDYLLLAHPLEPAGDKDADAGAGVGVHAIDRPDTEKFAGAVEVIKIVEYEFADEYQRTTRYRLWKLQGRRTAASPTFESATSGERVSSRPRPLTR